MRDRLRPEWVIGFAGIRTKLGVSRREQMIEMVRKLEGGGK